jgi:hypothetical protein
MVTLKKKTFNVLIRKLKSKQHNILMSEMLDHNNIILKEGPPYQNIHDLLIVDRTHLNII